MKYKMLCIVAAAALIAAAYFVLSNSSAIRVSRSSNWKDSYVRNRAKLAAEQLLPPGDAIQFVGSDRFEHLRKSDPGGEFAIVKYEFEPDSIDIDSTAISRADELVSWLLDEPAEHGWRVAVIIWNHGKPPVYLSGILQEP